MSTPRDTPVTDAPVAASPAFPWGALLVLALTAFILIATETMPAGLLPEIADGMGVTEGTVGLYVSAYALGTVLAAIPAVALTTGVRRRPLLVAALAGFLIANTVAALSTGVVVALIARLVGGAFSGLMWGMLAGYARRITAESQAGRALAIASVGTPIGLAIGTPLGAWIGTVTDWRWSFGALSVLTLVTIGLVLLVVPDAPGQPAETRMPLYRVVALPGIWVILLVIVAWMLAHNTVYTYVSAYLRSAAVGLDTALALVVFGVAALVGIGITSALADRALRPLVIGSVTGFAAAGLVLVLAQGSLVAVVAAIVLWGLAFGGAAAQVQTAIAEAAGENADVANALVGVAFNLAIFGAGILGAVLLGVIDPLLLPALMVGLGAVALVAVVLGRRAAFPVGR